MKDIYIKPKNRGSFKKAAENKGLDTQEFATKVLSNKNNYSNNMIKKAQFAKNASKWKHELGGTDRLACGGKRKKAFIGAIIGTVGGLASGIFGGISARKQRKRQERLQQEQTNKEEARSLTQSMSGQGEYNEDFISKFDNEEYSKGGETKVIPIISKGGIAKPLTNDTFLLRGRDHKSGGIIIGTGKNSIEAENNEVVKKDGNNLKIYSAQPILNGESPAEKVIKNPNKANKIFNEQEEYKRKNNLNDDGSKKNMNDKTISPVKKGKAELGIDAIAGIGSLVGSLTSGIAGLITTNKMKTPKAPNLYRAGKLKTNFDISPQLGSIERASRNINNEIDRNTASSVASLARKQGVLHNATDQTNQLYGQKENIETELINKDILNQQNVNNLNIDKLNQHNDRLVDFNNQKAAMRNQAINSIIGGATSAINDYANRVEAKDARNQNNIAIMAANPEVSPALLHSRGYKFDKSQIENFVKTAPTKEEKDYWNKVLTNGNSKNTISLKLINRLDNNSIIKPNIKNNYKLPNSLINPLLKKR